MVGCSVGLSNNIFLLPFFFNQGFKIRNQYEFSYYNKETYILNLNRWNRRDYQKQSFFSRKKAAHILLKKDRFINFFNLTDKPFFKNYQNLYSSLRNFTFSRDTHFYNDNLSFHYLQHPFMTLNNFHHLFGSSAISVRSLYNQRKVTHRLKKQDHLKDTNHLKTTTTRDLDYLSSLKSVSDNNFVENTNDYDANLCVNNTLSLYRRSGKIFFSLHRVFRVICLLIPLSGLSVAYFVAKALNITAYPVHNWLEETLWSYIYWAVPIAGPCYIKFIQWAATRADIFPAVLCRRCAHFFCSVQPHPFPYTNLILKESLGERWEEQLWLDPYPVGVGCIGQVYRGVWRDKSHGTTTETGTKPILYQEVAVKVTHPYVHKEMLADLNTMFYMSKLLETLPSLQWLALSDSIDQFSELMLKQLDMRAEALNLERFRMNFEHSKSSCRHLAKLGGRVLIPEVLTSTKKVLVESYEEGMTLGHWMRVTKEAYYDRKKQHLETSFDDAKWNAKGYFLSYLEQSMNGNAADSINGTKHKAIAYPIRFFKAFAPHVTHMAVSILQDTGSSIYQRIRINVTYLANQLALCKYGAPKSSFGKTESHDMYQHYWKRVASVGLSCFLQMVFVDNFVHADLHPGNIIVRFQKQQDFAPNHHQQKTIRNLVKQCMFRLLKHKGLAESNDRHHRKLSLSELKERLMYRYKYISVDPWLQLFSGKFTDVDFEVILLDCGLASSLRIKEFINFTDLARCVCLGEGYNAGKMMVQRARRQDCKDPEKFSKEVGQLVHTYYNASKGDLTLSKAKLGEYLSKILRLACQYSVELDPRFVSLIVAVMVLEGVGRQLDPELDLLRSALPYAKDLVVDVAG